MVIGMSSCGDTEATNKTDIGQPTYDIFMVIEFDGNLLFSKYDVDILIDDIEYLNLDHNVDGTFSVELEEGKHTLTVKKEDDRSVDGNANFSISEDATLKYKIYCSKDKVEIEEKTDEDVASKEDKKSSDSEELISEVDDDKAETEEKDEPQQVAEGETDPTSSDKILFEGYTFIEVDGGDLSGHRESNVVVEIGYGDREYFAFTNEYGQLVKVVADEIILQDEENEDVLSSGRYFYDEAKVPGTESSNLDEGHVIADSLGGVANAYNITPQNSTLNRHGDQAYMEKVIRDAGGCTDFVAVITYPDTKTQIPSHYSYTYTLRGNVINDEFHNVNPDEVNAAINENSNSEVPPSSTEGNESSGVVIT